MTDPAEDPFATPPQPSAARAVVPTEVDPMLLPSTHEERALAAACHILTIPSFAIPSGNILLPLAIWLFRKDDSPFVAAHAKEAINFQITILVAGWVFLALCFVLVGIPFFIATVVLDVVCAVVAAVKAYHGKPYRYPLTFRLVK